MTQPSGMEIHLTPTFLIYLGACLVYRGDLDTAINVATAMYDRVHSHADSAPDLG